MNYTGISYQLNTEDKNLSNILIDYATKFEIRMNKKPEKLFISNTFPIEKLTNFPIPVEQRVQPKNIFWLVCESI
jgi:hypothetical protein